MRITLALALFFPTIVIAQGAIEKIEVASQIAFSTPVGDVTTNILLTQDQNGYIELRALTSPNSGGITGLASIAGQTFYAPNVSFTFQDSNFLSGDLVDASKPTHVSADDLNTARPFPRSVGIAAVSVEIDGLYLIPSRAVDVSDIDASRRTIIRTHNGTTTLYFDGAAAGIPDTVGITALEILEAGNLLLSFDSSFSWGGLTVRPGDIIWHDGSSSGIPIQLISRAEIFGPCQSCIATGMAAEVDADVIFRTSFYDPWGVN